MKFELRNEAEETVDLDIFDDIGEGFFWSGVTPREVLARVNEAKGKTIQVRIHSRGGDVLDGLAIYNTIAQHSARVVVTVDGVAASMASVIAMAGDEIRMAPSALMMVHNPHGVARGEAGDLRAIADLLDKMTVTLAGIYAMRTGAKSSDVLAMMNAETWLSAEEAKAKGFATSITNSAPKTRAEGRHMQTQPIIPQAVAKAGLTSRYSELAKRIVTERDPAALAKLLEQRDALIREAERGAPSAAAQAGGAGGDYASLTNMQRHNLKNSDPARFDQLRGEHYKRIAEVRASLAGASNSAEYRTHLAELHRLERIPAA